jgi:hypothetical protein
MIIPRKKTTVITYDIQKSLKMQLQFEVTLKNVIFILFYFIPKKVKIYIKGINERLKFCLYRRNFSKLLKLCWGGGGGEENFDLAIMA